MTYPESPAGSERGRKADAPDPRIADDFDRVVGGSAERDGRRRQGEGGDPELAWTRHHRA